MGILRKYQRPSSSAEGNKRNTCTTIACKDHLTTSASSLRFTWDACRVTETFNFLVTRNGPVPEKSRCPV